MFLVDMEDRNIQDSVFHDMTAKTNIGSGELSDDGESHDVHQPTEVESLCVNCGKNGITTLLLAKIPHYREIILSSFICESCGFRNNDVQSGGVIQPLGVTYKVE